jgi:uncharacterized protein YxjI
MDEPFVIENEEGVSLYLREGKLLAIRPYFLRADGFGGSFSQVFQTVLGINQNCCQDENILYTSVRPTG